MPQFLEDVRKQQNIFVTQCCVTKLGVLRSPLFREQFRENEIISKTFFPIGGFDSKVPKNLVTLPLYAKSPKV